MDDTLADEEPEIETMADDPIPLAPEVLEPEAGADVEEIEESEEAEEE